MNATYRSSCWNSSRFVPVEVWIIFCGWFWTTLKPVFSVDIVVCFGFSAGFTNRFVKNDFGGILLYYHFLNNISYTKK